MSSPCCCVRCCRCSCCIRCCRCLRFGRCIRFPRCMHQLVCTARAISASRAVCTARGDTISAARAVSAARTVSAACTVRRTGAASVGAASVLIILGAGRRDYTWRHGILAVTHGFVPPAWRALEVRRSTYMRTRCTAGGPSSLVSGDSSAAERRRLSLGRRATLAVAAGSIAKRA